MDNNNPEWKQSVIPLKSLCNADYDRALKFVCWDWDSRGRRDLIGEFQTTLNKIDKDGIRKYELKHPKKKV